MTDRELLQSISDIIIGKIGTITDNMATKEDLSNMATKEDLSSMATKEDISNMATKEDISNIRAEIRQNSNLILSAFDQTEQKMYARFDKVNEDMAKMREDIHTTRYSNEAVELILKKTADLEERVNKLENLQKIS